MKLSHWSGSNLKDLRSRSTSSSVVVGVVGVICLSIVSIAGSASFVVTGEVMSGGELVASSFDAVDAAVGGLHVAMGIVGSALPAVSRFVVVAVAVGLKMELPICDCANQQGIEHRWEFPRLVCSVTSSRGMHSLVAKQQTAVIGEGPNGL